MIRKALLALVLGICNTAVAGTVETLTPADLSRLRQSIENSYADPSQVSFDRDLLTDPRWAGPPVVAMLLGHVVRHADRRAGDRDLQKNLDLLTWAFELAMDREVPPATPFERRLVQRRLNTLFSRFQSSRRLLDAVVALLDVTKTWNSRQVRYLTVEAGSRRSLVARYAYETLASLEPWSDADVAVIANTVRRRPAALRTPAQWGLLVLTGLATSDEYTHVITLAADLFANWDPAGEAFDDGHPLRGAIEELIRGYDLGDEIAIELYDRAWAKAIDGAMADPRYKELVRFFDIIHDPGWRLSRAVEPAPMTPTDRGLRRRARRRAFRSRHPQRGNVVYPEVWQRGCGGGLTSTGEPSAFQ